MDKIPSRNLSSGGSNVSYLYGGVVQYRPGETLGPRILPDYELVLIIDGQVTYRANGLQYEAPPGSVILARPDFHEHYTWDPDRRTRHAYIHFNVSRRAEDWPPPSQWPIVRQRPDPSVVALFQTILRRANSHPEWPALAPGRIENRLIDALITLFLDPVRTERNESERSRPAPVNAAIRWMLELLDKNPHRSVTLKELARKAGVSDKHLCRLFGACIGRGPMQTLVLLRLQLAVALLARSNLSIKETADRCGFENPLYFSRRFSQAYGSPPTHLRRKLAKGIHPRFLLPADITPRMHW